MKRPYKLLTLTAVCTLGLSSLGTTYVPNQVKANQLNDVQQKKQKIQGEISEKNTENTKLEDEATNIRNQIKQLEAQILTTSKKVTAKENEVAATQKEIDQLKAQISELEKRIKERDELLKERMKDIQTNGGAVRYVDVLVAAESFSDFLNKAGALGLIVEQDKDIIETQKKEKQMVEEKETQVADKLVVIEKDLKSLESLNDQLAGQKEEKNKFVAALTEEQKKVQSEIDDLEGEVAALNAQEAEIKEQIRQAEEAARKEAQATAQVAQEKASGGSSAQASVATPSFAAPSSGGFIRPTSGRFSSGFGMRGGRPHNGVDIAAPEGTPIVAAASGRVIASTMGRPGNYGGYGNVVVIRHNLDGKTYDTLYAHMVSRSVSVGQTVSQGQVIGGVGNTGDSQGNHLHFEIHPGGYKNPVNPASFGIN
ncbi:murein hydrolase activator EnvC family protein [Massilibacterium senegalense]|uniref:murein hydrolase activator EnvC family protein n=1 Tax=Massilibacterium senegalense TaxID=1632858 RepID=UPI00078528FA|nr:peptidoglycan DD-metalloendopeptidase family protein [Massilibacterium senegalense]